MNTNDVLQVAPLSLYVCVRFGHAESPEGAAGEDTNFMVRAFDHQQAAEVADKVLRMLPTQIDGTTRLVMSPLEFMQRLAAPKPRSRLRRE